MKGGVQISKKSSVSADGKLIKSIESAVCI
jgi:hypothetical protein